MAGTVKVNILNNPIPPFLLASCKQKGLHAKQKFTLQLFNSNSSKFIQRNRLTAAVAVDWNGISPVTWYWT